MGWLNKSKFEEDEDTSPQSAPRKVEPAPQSKASPDPSAKPAAQARAAEPAKKVAPAKADGYGIDKAVAMMQQLEQRLGPTNVEAQVVAASLALESAGVHVRDIVQDARDKESRLEGEVARLEGEIKDLQSQIKKRQDQVKEHRDVLKETTRYRERLELAAKDEAKPRDEAKPKDAKAESKAEDPAAKPEPQKLAVTSS